MTIVMTMGKQIIETGNIFPGYLLLVVRTIKINLTNLGDKQHGMEMFQENDEAHLKAMNEMQELMKEPEAMKGWFENKKKEFEALPDA